MAARAPASRVALRRALIFSKDILRRAVPVAFASPAKPGDPGGYSRPCTGNSRVAWPAPRGIAEMRNCRIITVAAAAVRIGGREEIIVMHSHAGQPIDRRPILVVGKAMKDTPCRAGIAAVDQQETAVLTSGPPRV